MWEHKLCGQKYKDFELMLIQVVLSYRIVFSKCCQLKREALCLQICFEMFAKIFGSIFNKDVCLQHPRKQITLSCITVNKTCWYLRNMRECVD